MSVGAGALRTYSEHPTFTACDAVGLVSYDPTLALWQSLANQSGVAQIPISLSDKSLPRNHQP